MSPEAGGASVHGWAVPEPCGQRVRAFVVSGMESLQKPLGCVLTLTLSRVKTLPLQLENRLLLGVNGRQGEKQNRTRSSYAIFPHVPF